MARSFFSSPPPDMDDAHYAALRTELIKLRRIALGSLTVAVAALIVTAFVWFARRGSDELAFRYGPARAVFSATQVSLVNAEGARVELEPTGIRFFGASGEQMIGLSATEVESSAALWMHSRDGKSSLGAYVSAEGRPELFMGMRGEQRGEGKAHLTFSQSGKPTLQMQGADRSEATYSTVATTKHAE